MLCCTIPENVNATLATGASAGLPSRRFRSRNSRPAQALHARRCSCLLFAVLQGPGARGHPRAPGRLAGLASPARERARCRAGWREGPLGAQSHRPGKPEGLLAAAMAATDDAKGLGNEATQKVGQDARNSNDERRQHCWRPHWRWPRRPTPSRGSSTWARGVTQTARMAYEAHMFALWVCVVIGVIVFGAMGYAMFKFRKSKGAVAATVQPQHHRRDHLDGGPDDHPGGDGLAGHGQADRACTTRAIRR